MIFRCHSRRQVHPNVVNPFELVADDPEHCRRILIAWLGAKIAARVTIVPAADTEPVYEEAKS